MTPFWLSTGWLMRLKCFGGFCWVHREQISSIFSLFLAIKLTFVWKMMLFVELTGQWKIGKIQQSVVETWKQILQRGKLSWSLGSISRQVRKCVALTAVMSAVIEATHCVASWCHGEQYEYENISPYFTPLWDFFFLQFQITVCYVWIILVLCALRRMSNKVSVQRMWRKDLKLPTLTMCCRIWVVAFVAFLPHHDFCDKPSVLELDS